MSIEWLCIATPSQLRLCSYSYSFNLLCLRSSTMWLLVVNSSMKYNLFTTLCNSINKSEHLSVLFYRVRMREFALILTNTPSLFIVPDTSLLGREAVIWFRKLFRPSTFDQIKHLKTHLVISMISYFCWNISDAFIYTVYIYTSAVVLLSCILIVCPAMINI